MITRAAFPALDEPRRRGSAGRGRADDGGIFDDDSLDLASLTGLDAPPPP